MFLKRDLKIIFMLLLITATATIPALSARAGDNAACKADITSVIKSYEKALNGSNVKKVIRLYAKDGVFMPANKPTSVGKAQVTKAYQYVFKALDLNVTFHIDEIVRRDDLAFVRTSSDGKITLRDKNTTIKNNSRELFVMKRIDGSWKIYRYMFNEVKQG